MIRTCAWSVDKPLGSRSQPESMEYGVSNPAKPMLISMELSGARRPAPKKVSCCVSDLFFSGARFSFGEFHYKYGSVFFEGTRFGVVLKGRKTDPY